MKMQNSFNNMNNNSTNNKNMMSNNMNSFNMNNNYQNNQIINNNMEDKDLEILNLKNELNNARNIIEQQKILINNLQDQINNNSNIYQNIINQKEQELNNLKIKLQNIKPQNQVFANKNSMMSVNFISMDKKISFSIPCIDTDTLAEVEEILYIKFPEYRETNNNFIANGEPVLRFKTIGQNKIGNGLPVTMIIP